MPSKGSLINAMEQIFDVASSEDGDLDEVGAIAADCLGYEWPPPDEEETD